MIYINPFSSLSELVPSIVMQVFLITMIALVVIGTLVDIIHKKNVKYFFENAKKAKKNATKELRAGERVSVIAKTVVYDIATTSELGAGKRSTTLV
jgi:cytochrome b561